LKRAGLEVDSSLTKGENGEVNGLAKSNAQSLLMVRGKGGVRELARGWGFLVHK